MTAIHDLTAAAMTAGFADRSLSPVEVTRAVLDRYAAGGGTYREVVLPDVGHSPHVERPQEFVVALLEHLDVSVGQPADSA